MDLLFPYQSIRSSDHEIMGGLLKFSQDKIWRNFKKKKQAMNARAAPFVAVPFVHCLKIQFQALSLLITKWGGSKFSRSKDFEKNLQ